MYMYEHYSIPICEQSCFNWILFWEIRNAEYNHIDKIQCHLKIMIYGKEKIS